MCLSSLRLTLIVSEITPRRYGITNYTQKYVFSIFANCALYYTYGKTEVISVALAQGDISTKFRKFFLSKNEFRGSRVFYISYRLKLSHLQGETKYFQKNLRYWELSAILALTAISVILIEYRKDCFVEKCLGVKKRGRSK